jgi:hypothetical protein
MENIATQMRQSKGGADRGFLRGDAVNQQVLNFAAKNPAFKFRESP